MATAFIIINLGFSISFIYRSTLNQARRDIVIKAALIAKELSQLS